ncbi:2-oxo-4-hydroxy-4-carboxy-5-ureidoimidazoline decarboxylase [Enterobacter sp. A11]|uniref:2-oxo-4-hydroxy-4-carboxy-5-ureidoimidazoline decarboxylase n=1 Tax=unclassified Enterobacter TaxID=2608935 RepID=UPI0010704CC1|nr:MULTISPECIES: 2-oxo-4-hydroxy-4-carboxy-5-ureidoimidazoline decarboxylase [unclassified Enterobacter]MBM1020128.1 2-oxo-4-hydroxy-4-carboxy-5-ureidoimidazoline decarboxylase [Enterobacter sp. E1]MEA3561428.1 2-oxo-4-hydroxy-4-carboxy-5-ureidoimidazoline decarboxylase [Enterobacter sp. GM-22]MEA3595275.1 2-oxo-4-hydroxy-4-carboxy-5-ureidoimidazoline decarboxylase [Enterobacter sp. GM-31]TFF60408.1 2-oxo-4-hydroxy-4-carboxy-5-ureidoimidazoline decarboxylase [Enterobacter sp. A11]
MIALHDFNHLPDKDALALLRPCVAIPAWAEALVRGRPYPSREALFNAATAQAQTWDDAALAQALSAHPRIGEKLTGSQAEAALSRQEQGAVNDRDATLAQALREGNARYEARFGRVFLIRAKGRSGEDILQALHARLENSDAQEVRVALEQLREITLLRLEGVINE